MGMCYQLFWELWQDKKKLCTPSTSILFSDAFNSWLNLQMEKSETWGGGQLYTLISTRGASWKHPLLSWPPGLPIVGTGVRFTPVCLQLGDTACWLSGKVLEAHHPQMGRRELHLLESPDAKSREMDWRWWTGQSPALVDNLSDPPLAERLHEIARLTHGSRRGKVCRLRQA